MSKIETTVSAVSRTFSITGWGGASKWFGRFRRYSEDEARRKIAKSGDKVKTAAGKQDV
jgi:hypothetical protein